MTFLEPLEIFTNLQRNFQKILNPSTPWNELAAPRTLKIIENGPWLKKSGHPCYITCRSKLIQKEKDKERQRETMRDINVDNKPDFKILGNCFVLGNKARKYGFAREREKESYIKQAGLLERQSFGRDKSTVKLGYNELGYNEHLVITNKYNFLVGLAFLKRLFSRLLRTETRL